MVKEETTFFVRGLLHKRSNLLSLARHQTVTSFLRKKFLYQIGLVLGLGERKEGWVMVVMLVSRTDLAVRN